MDVEGRFEDWFASLSEVQRFEVLRSSGELPPWMVASLQQAGIPPVPVLHSDTSLLDRGYLMPTQLRDFIDEQR